MQAMVLNSIPWTWNILAFASCSNVLSGVLIADYATETELITTCSLIGPSFCYVRSHVGKTKSPNTLSSNRHDKAITATYANIQRPPKGLVSRHLARFIAISIKATVDSNIRAEYPIPPLLINKGSPFFTIVVSSNHGNPRQIKISNTLLPMEFETAISP